MDANWNAADPAVTAEAAEKKPKAKAKKAAAKKPKPKAKAKKAAAKKPKPKAKPPAPAKKKKKAVAKKPKKKAAAPAVMRSERVDFRLSKDEKARLTARAAKLRRTITSIVLEAIEKIK